MAKRKLPANMKKKNLSPIWIILAVVVLVIGVFVYRGVREISGNPIYTSQDQVPRISGEEAARAVNEQVLSYWTLVRMGNLKSAMLTEQ